ncbi:MAG TPA: DUF3592 domain-containing protein [Actinophytocola sp.]|uniref:DUF3592 domain-containing protein n=1 Tax=Actinophytocola sp. TaxID=1872138 RepID=UPI002DB7D498|nr:DUF3592 domain-containing protein [Actinophytocola sp.]HEU5470187.1 DUF3592 domain-containing protein [Actinophytocola sp.]
MPRSARKVIVWVLVAQVAWMLPAALYLGFLWRTTDEVDRSYPCRGGATCYSGPTTYLVLMLVFGGLGVAMAVGVGWLAVRWRRRSVERDRLVAEGLRIPAQLVGVAGTNTRINGRRVYRLTFESRALDRPVRVVERATAPPVIGLRATIAYDPAAPRRAVLVEDVEELISPMYLHKKEWREV